MYMFKGTVSHYLSKPLSFEFEAKSFETASDIIRNKYMVSSEHVEGVYWNDLVVKLKRVE